MKSSLSNKTSSLEELILLSRDLCQDTSQLSELVVYSKDDSVLTFILSGVEGINYKI